MLLVLYNTHIFHIIKKERVYILLVGIYLIMPSKAKDKTCIVVGEKLLASAQLHELNISKICREAIEREVEIIELAMLNNL